MSKRKLDAEFWRDMEGLFRLTSPNVSAQRIKGKWIISGKRSDIVTFKKNAVFAARSTGFVGPPSHAVQHWLNVLWTRAVHKSIKDPGVRELLLGAHEH